MYQLVFTGQCTPGADASAVRENASQIFKTSPTQLERMFSGGRVIIRTKLDADAAARYQAALANKGMVVHIEPMTPQADAPAPASQPVKPRSASENSSRTGWASVNPGPVVEPGERLPVAGERVDQLLAGSALTLGRPGEILGQSRAMKEPVFEHLDAWTVAAVGETLVEPAPKPKVAVPDISHLKVLPAS